MRVPLVLLGGIVVLSDAVARALSCVCSPLECDPLTDEDCPGGLTWDPCRCCKVCARIEGEPCGGLFGFSGSCAVGLQCLIQNLLPHAREVDEGICTKIPGRSRRHCPHGPKLMSESGCNLVGEGFTSETGNDAVGGKCVCGRSVLWCPEERKPYTYRTRHECELNLKAKVAYDEVQMDAAAEETSVINGHVHNSVECPEDSVLADDGKCKCVSTCPKEKCESGQQPILVREAIPDTPGSCCPLYDCHIETSAVLIATEDTDDAVCYDGTGRPRDEGEDWKDTDCVFCTCKGGKVSCHTTMCRSCEFPLPLKPGECCQHCPEHHNVTKGCSPMDHCQLHCDYGFLMDSNNCPICQCSKEETADVTVDGKSCPELPHCRPDCERHKDEDGCPVCVCKPTTPVVVVDDKNKTTNDDIVGVKEICPSVDCDLHCELGLIMDENDCTLCQCKPHPGCPTVIPCKKKCPMGYKMNRRGCPVCRCRISCVDHFNQTHPEGSTWKPNSCTTCNCDSGGRLSCEQTICSVGCSNPEPPKPGTCCPVCPITTTEATEDAQTSSKGWGTIPITLISVLAILCALLMVHIVRTRFRGRLSPTDNSYSSYPSQYYKCVPHYESSSRNSEKIVPL